MSSQRRLQAIIFGRLILMCASIDQGSLLQGSLAIQKVLSTLPDGD